MEKSASLTADVISASTTEIQQGTLNIHCIVVLLQNICIIILLLLLLLLILLLLLL